jgi:hypothetical protein
MVEFGAVRFAGLLDGFVLHYGFAVVAKSADRFVDLFGHRVAFVGHCLYLFIAETTDK